MIKSCSIQTNTDPLSRTNAIEPVDDVNNPSTEVLQILNPNFAFVSSIFKKNKNFTIEKMQKINKSSSFGTMPVQDLSELKGFATNGLACA